MKYWLEKIEGGITAVPGVEAAGVHCGLKKNGEKDLALLYCPQPAVAAGVFTSNRFKAPPLKVTENHIENLVRAVVINSGNANACTGLRGENDALATAGETAARLALAKEEVLVASTGVIGSYLPLEKMFAGIQEAVEALSDQGGSDAAQAIMTTDTISKQVAYRFQVEGGGSFVIGGMAKGSGMICPDMATMLAFLATDAGIEKTSLQKALQECVNYSFNAITVDGDTSTNDMVLLLSTGSGNLDITEGSMFWEPFKEALMQVCSELAYMIVADGEGTTKVLRLTIKGAVDYKSGKKLAYSVLNSPLVKTAFFGEDANWGRIVTALGYSNVDFDPEKVDISLGHVQVAARGEAVAFDESEAKAALMKAEIPIEINMHMGTEEITFWGSDLSYEYISINGAYRS